jgi:FAD/FMN-containing dehydrogenase
MKLVAASTMFLGGIHLLKGSWAYGATARSSPLGELPSLDGELRFNDADRQAAASDFGRHIHRAPIAVLRPGSVHDIVRMVAYANQHGLKIAMRGQGHCLYGQAQVEGGIVIDSSTLNAVRWQGSNALDAEPGALWGEVVKTALAHGLTPPVVPDALILSVGGLLSVGGTGETSYRSGAVVDHVLELDVVTGAGELMTCSSEGNNELFRMTLAGLGQCGIIVRARLHLVPAPTDVAMRTLTYDDLDTLLSDQARLATVEALGPLGGGLIREADGRWRFVLRAGTFLTQPDDGANPPSWMAGLQFKAEAPAARMSYWEYLDRQTAGIAAAKASGKPSPSLALMLPDSAVQPFLTHVLSTPEASIGIWRIESFPMITARFTQPLHKIPGGPMAFTLRLQRRSSAEHAPDHEAMLAANRTLLPRMRTVGGKIYPPFAPILSRVEWQEHYGPETWQHFAAAKKRFDPNNVLTPGAGIF